MNRLLVCLVVAQLQLIGCSLTTANRVGVATAFATVAIDAVQTLKLSNDGWRDSHEAGLPSVFFGSRPTTNQLAVYDVGLVATMIAAYLITPERIRPVIYTPLILEQGYVIYGNAQILATQNTAVAHK